MITRWLALPKAKSVLIIGPRRAGKTTFLKQSLPNIPYITMDDFDYLQLAKTDPKSIFAEHPKSLIIDEIQRVPQLLITVKDRIDNYGQIVWMTGSSSIGLLSSGSETLAARIKLLECPTLCWGEELGAARGKSLVDKPSPLELNAAARRLASWLKYGGFPEVRLADAEKLKREILHDYRNTYFARDLLMLANLEDARGLLACMHHLAQSIGSRLDVSSVSKESGLSYPTASKYLNSLEAARLVFRLTGYQFGLAKRQIKANKFYFCDVSIATALGAEISEGQRFELMVISELEKRRKLGRFNADFLHYYESESGKEIDLIIDEGKAVTAIEIKSTTNPGAKDTAGLKSFALKQRNKKLRKVLITKSLQFGKIADVELWPAASLCRYR
jgi:hypothetical protein